LYRYTQATLCGLSHADGTVELAPDDNTVIAYDDEVVLLAESSVVKISPPDEASIPWPGSEYEYMKSIKKTSREKPLNILFAGFGDETPIAIELATEMAPPGSVVTILAEDIPPEDARVGLDTTLHHVILQSKHGSIDDSQYVPCNQSGIPQE
jgi:hypothetical protein